MINSQQRLSKFDRFPILYQNFYYLSGYFSFDLIHQLHSLDNTDRLTAADAIAYLHKDGSPGAGER